MLKKTGLLCAALTALLFLAGCDESSDSSSSTQEAAAGIAAPASSTPSALPNIPVAFTSITAGIPNEAKTLSGAGGTFPAQLYAVWFDQYGKRISVQVTYKGVGSGAGIKAIANREVDFGASDAPMTEAQMDLAKGGDILHIPTALGAIVPTYNVPGVKSQLKFTAETIAGIYLGQITRWNDSRLVADNPELASVNQPIIAVHRGDGSGTTYGLTQYLSATVPAFAQRVGTGTSVTWPIGLGAVGNGGVSDEVRDNPYSFGYVELNFAIQKKMAYGSVKNRAGRFINPTLESVTAAAAAIAQSAPADLRFSIVNAPGESSYPIGTGTWLLVYKNQTDEAKAVALTRMLWWATHDGQSANKELNYAPVPAELTARSEQLIRQITVNGKPAFPGTAR